MSFLPYPEYRVLEGMGPVPAHWQVCPFKRFIARIESGTSVNAVDVPAPNGAVGVLKTSCVYRGVFDPSENKLVVADELERVSCPVRANTLIVSRMNTPELIGAAGVVNASVGNLYLPDRLWQISFVNADPCFVHFWTLTSLYRDQIQAACIGTSASMKNIGQDEFGELIFPAPPIHEQVLIAGFLSSELENLDGLIIEQERLIELLAEKRHALISHAVTKGLNPDAPMKSSGVQWLGDIPANWDVKQLRRVVTIAEGQVDPEDPRYSELPLIAPNHIASGTGRLLEVETAGAQGAESGKYLCRGGDVVYSKIRPALRKVCIAPQDCLCSADMYPLRPHSEMTAEFLFWWLLSEQFSALAVVESQRVAMPKINRESLNALVLPVPPRGEQSAISAYLRRETARLDALVDQASTGIVLLEERRASLISAAVTGQIDVRGLSVVGVA